MSQMLSVSNSDGKAAAYISGDPSRNRLTLSLTNPSSQTLQLKAGPPAPEPPEQGGAPTLYVSLGALAPQSGLATLTVAATGWTAELLGTAPHTTWALSPASPLTLAPGAAISIVVSALAVAGPPRPATVAVDYYNLTGLQDGASSLIVPIINPPTTTAELPLRVDFDGPNIVYVSNDPKLPISNRLVVSLSNPSPSQPLVQAPWGASKPEILLSFVTGDQPGYSALATADEISAAKVAFSVLYPDGWSQEGPITDSGTPYWRLTPLTREVLGVGPAAVAEFTIGNLITQLQPGLTIAYLQYSNMPGYNDGFRTLMVSKQAPQPGILAFESLTPAIIKLGDPVSLNWQTFSIQQLTLSWMDHGQSFSRTLPDITFNDTYAPPKLSASTTYTLEAYDINGVKVQKQVTVTVVQPAPAITSFSFAPAYADLLNHGQISLNWTVSNVQNARQLTLTWNDAEGRSQTTLLDLNASSVQQNVFHPGGADFTLKVDNASDPTSHDSRTVTVHTWEDVLTMVDVPAGTVIPYSGNSAKLAGLHAAGWLLCDGSQVSKQTYPDLWAAIGATFGDAGANFVLPDLRGLFLRGVDDNTGRDPDRGSRTHGPGGGVAGAVVGSYQADQLANHHHNWDHFFYWFSNSGSDIAAHQPADSMHLQTNPRQATNNDGGGAETRPKNVYVYYLIAAGSIH